MTRMRIAKTTAGVHTCPKWVSEIDWITPMMRPPTTAPLRLPIPPMTAAVKAIRPAVKPWLNWIVPL